MREQLYPLCCRLHREKKQMIKVLIVDDEYYFRQAFKKLLDWNAHGFTIIGEAATDAEALLHIPEADLVFMDINISKRNGLEVIKESITRGDTALFVIISGYAEFEYAQTAIRYDVLDFLVKPVNKGELFHVLAKVTKQLTSEEKVSEQLNDQSAVETAISSGEKIVQDVRAYIDSHFTDPRMNVMSISKEFFMNYQYLSRLFKQQANTNMISYISRKRLMFARQCFDQGMKKVDHVAAKAGYDDPQYFSKCFKKEFGMTPKQYVKSSN